MIKKFNHKGALVSSLTVVLLNLFLFVSRRLRYGKSEGVVYRPGPGYPLLSAILGLIEWPNDLPRLDLN